MHRNGKVRKTEIEKGSWGFLLLPPIARAALDWSQIEAKAWNLTQVSHWSGEHYFNDLSDKVLPPKVSLAGIRTQSSPGTSAQAFWHTAHVAQAAEQMLPPVPTPRLSFLNEG